MNPLHDWDSTTLIYMKSGTVYDPDRKQQFVGKVVAWLQKKVEERLLGETQAAYVVIAVAPGHSPTSPLSFMHEIVGTVIQNNLFQDGERMVSRVHDGRNLLIRTWEVAKQATSHEIRSEETHRNSIAVNPSGVDVTGKIVCVLDDVWTSGCTLRVCAEKIRNAGANDVRMLAIGKTYIAP